MAGLTGITTRIIKDAEQKVSELRRAAISRETAIMEEAENEVREKRAESRRLASEVAGRNVRRIQIAGNIEARKETLAAKQAIIDDCFKSAVEKMSDLPKSEYDAITARMIAKIPDGASMEKVDLSPESGGGFLLRNGPVTLSFSFEAIAKQIRPNCEGEIVKILGW